MTRSANKTGRSWVPAAIAGAIVGIVLLVAGGGLVFAVVGGLAIFGIGLVLLPRGKASETEVTREVSRPAAPVQREVQTAPAPADPVATPAEPEPTPEPQATDVQPAPDVTTPTDAEQPGLTASTLVKASKALPGQVDLATRKGSWRFENKPASA
ncbi:hypothetical protein [Sedimentitalea todarodis]|uniref:Uncharacterized protein n=1 Tax=Sedimentitalea todarodis TaxID=1631240 RepID=A0ABU3VA63_9RHOB|nr:hypothetical protein [Sedimentitalea todarodis]MDU9002654.1 hypothetical protein [Sedimentitalea todarodis]